MVSSSHWAINLFWHATYLKKEQKAGEIIRSKIMFTEKILSGRGSVRHVPSRCVLSHHKKVTETENFTLVRFFQAVNQKQYQKMVLNPFVHLWKTNIFCFMHKGVVQKLSLPRPLEYQTLNGHKSVNFWARDFSFWI